MTCVETVSILILYVLHGPLLDFDHSVKAQYHVNYYVLVLETTLPALDYGFTHIRISEHSSI